MTMTPEEHKAAMKITKDHAKKFLSILNEGVAQTGSDQIDRWCPNYALCVNSKDSLTGKGKDEYPAQIWQLSTLPIPQFLDSSEITHPYLAAAGFALAFLALGVWLHSIVSRYQLLRLRKIVELQRIQLGGMK